MENQLFVVERYQDSGASEPLQPFPLLPAGLHLAWAVHVPGDDLVMALIEGSDEQSISAAVTAAGWRVDRIVPAAWAQSATTPDTSTTLGGGTAR